jgi:hypothetical protein
MDWSNERYVRLYTRDTRTWLKLKWEGQSLLALLIRKMDRSGILDDMEEPIEDISLVTGFPEEHTKVGLERLIKYGVVHINTDNTLVMPNYIDAQESSKTDKQRQRESRERRKARAQSVTKRDDLVTKCDGNVTSGHNLSQPVTPTCAVLCSTVVEPKPAPQEKRRKPAKEKKATGISTPTWIAYSEAYKKAYGVEMKRSPKNSALCKELVSRLGAEDAPKVAVHYFQSSNPWYRQRYHVLELLVRDAEPICADMKKNQTKKQPFVDLESVRPDMEE